MFPYVDGMIWGGKNPYFWFNTRIYRVKNDIILVVICWHPGGLDPTLHPNHPGFNTLDLDGVIFIFRRFGACYTGSAGKSGQHGFMMCQKMVVGCIVNRAFWPPKSSHV